MTKVGNSYKIEVGKDGEVGLPQHILDLMGWKEGQEILVDWDAQFKEVYLWIEDPSKQTKSKSG